MEIKVSCNFYTLYFSFKSLPPTPSPNAFLLIFLILLSYFYYLAFPLPSPTRFMSSPFLPNVQRSIILIPLLLEYFHPHLHSTCYLLLSTIISILFYVYYGFCELRPWVNLNPSLVGWYFLNLNAILQTLYSHTFILNGSSSFV